MTEPIWRLSGTLGALAVLASLQPTFASAQQQVAFASAGQPGQVTWAENVAPILYASCVECHNPEGIGPMSLLDYQTARRYAAMSAPRKR